MSGGPLELTKSQSSFAFALGATIENRARDNVGEDRTEAKDEKINPKPETRNPKSESDGAGVKYYE
jgi:hypothetical protein